MPMPAPVPSALAIDVSDLTVAISQATVLDRVSFTLEPGRILGVLGANGAGKSTLAQALVGLRRITRGTVTVLGERLPWRDRGRYAQLGYVPQETALYEELTVREQLTLAATVYALPGIEQALTRSLAWLGLTAVADTRAGRLSGGMRRRVVIARALLHQPALLVVDEPTLAVDAETRQLIWDHLGWLRTQGRTVVIATNYLEEAHAVCDGVVVLRQGRAVLTETITALRLRLGYHLTITCAADARDALRTRLRDHPGLSRCELTASGLTMTLRARSLGEIEALCAALPGVSAWHCREGDLSDIAPLVTPGA